MRSGCGQDRGGRKEGRPTSLVVGWDVSGPARGFSVRCSRAVGAEEQIALNDTPSLCARSCRVRSTVHIAHRPSRFTIDPLGARSRH